MSPRWSALYREFSELPLHTSVWRGTLSGEDAELLTDGTTIIRRSAALAMEGDRLESLPDPSEAMYAVESRAVEKMWKKWKAAAEREVWPVWQHRLDGWEGMKLMRIPCRAYCIERDTSPDDYFDPREEHVERTICLDAIRARLICWLTHPTGLLAQENPTKPVVWQREGEPVAMQAPVYMQAHHGRIA